MEACTRKTQGRRTLVQKLSRLPDDFKVHKRPLLRAPLVSPYSGKRSEKVVYLGSKTPFMSAFKRVKQLLRHVEKRDTQASLSQQRRGRKRGLRNQTSVAVELSEPVLVKATGKAIDKALQLALFLTQQNDLAVAVRTGSVDAIDDLVEDSTVELDHVSRANIQDTSAMDTDGVGPPETDFPDGVREENLHGFPESRIRRTSLIMIEVTLSSR